MRRAGICAGPAARVTMVRCVVTVRPRARWMHGGAPPHILPGLLDARGSTRGAVRVGHGRPIGSLSDEEVTVMVDAESSATPARPTVLRRDRRERDGDRAGGSGQEGGAQEAPRSEELAEARGQAAAPTKKTAGKKARHARRGRARRPRHPRPPPRTWPQLTARAGSRRTACRVAAVEGEEPPRFPKTPKASRPTHPSDEDEEDAPAQQVATAGATVDRLR